MPLIKRSPDAPPERKEAPVRITAPEYQGVTVDSRYTNLSALLAYVEGSPWTVNYYVQVTDNDSGIQGQQLNASPIHQGYDLVKQFVLRVTSPLVPVNDDQGRLVGYTGSANVIPGLIPNEGDMFLADVNDGRQGLFQVNKSRRMTVRKDTVHQIDYAMVNFSTPEILADLDAKTLNTLVYVADFLNYNQSPFLQEEAYNVVEQLQDAVPGILDTYIHQFFSNDFKTLQVPCQELPVYDHFLTEAFLKLFSTFDTPDIRRIKLLNVMDDPVMKATSIWDVLLDRRPSLMKRTFTKVGNLGARLFTHNALMEGVYYSGFAYVVYPTNPEKFVANNSKLGKTMVTAPHVVRPDIVDTLPEATPPLIPQSGTSEYYLFSQAFYEGEAGSTPLTQLEAQVKAYLNEEALDNSVLLNLANTYLDWNPLDQFYFGPVILLLIKMSIRSF